MTTPTQNSGLAAADFTGQRDEALTQTVQALFWMNGGAAVALLAFLQAIWKDSPQLSRSIVYSLVPLSIGIGLAGCVHLLRYSASRHFQAGDSTKGHRARRWYLALAWGSIVAFFVGVATVLLGALCAL